MKDWLMQGTLVTCIGCVMMIGSGRLAGAQELTPEQKKAVQKEVQRILRERQEGATPLPPPSTDFGESALPANKPLDQLSGQRVPHKYGSTAGGSGKLIYAKPFVANPKAILGGYMDFSYRNASNQGNPSTFDVTRFVPFIYADVSQHVKMASEIEIEHGIREVSNNEISLEFATIDFLMAEPVNVRAGVVLLPVGKFNLLHDSPLRDLTDRPFVDTFIIPTTLSETGVGLYGTFFPTRLSKLDYEIYVTTGFNGFKGDGVTPRISEKKGLKNARQRKSQFADGLDNNNGKAVVGRLAFSPILGVEIGGSGYFGAYDPKSKRALSIWAVDWTLQRGPFELIGESAWAYVKDNHLNLDGTLAIDPDTGRVRPRRMSGFYIQGNFHFLPPILTRLAPSFFRPEVSTLTAMVRWEQSDTNRDVNGDLGERQRLTLGLNYRPTEETVFKTAFQYLPETLSNMDQRIHDTAFVASIATYF